jgi:hypothetical protein
MIRRFLEPRETDYNSGDGSSAEEMAYGLAWRDWRNLVDAQPERIRRLLEHNSGIVRGIGAIAGTLGGVEIAPSETSLES